ncbi:MarR family winged helix-turn-helix transcriptional regulator [Krasilnikoviella flava]|uniref:DNA-binding transcriptional regulator, MarR family n=1 Tax=Krasilnikoviella flava TaxID=526729 RepID=A0A1T5J5Z5_9MICO|nr:MarR family transcriptional regulator [Krasilnikoviella flava]SKC46809.1 DNA-binding transcriptional regulator, MarR family [Krasilnikoviella flava]
MGATRTRERDDDGGGAEVRWLDEEQQWAWRRFLEGTSRFFEALGDAHDVGLPVTLGEYHLLVQLSEAPERTLRMSALAEFLALSRSRLTHTVDRMERRGLVVRNPVPGDRRGVNCVMTDAGYAALVDAAPGHVTAVRRLLVDALEPGEMAVLGRAMAKIAATAKGLDPAVELATDPAAPGARPAAE